MIPRQEILDATSHCPCPSCIYLKYCKTECYTFQKYVNTNSPAKREQQLRKFKEVQNLWRESA